MNAILSVAQKELTDGIRNRWVLSITLIFAILAIGISWFGAAAVGRVGFTSIPNTIASLASLAVFIIPLIALLLAYNAIVGEDEDGTLLLLLTYPVSRAQLLLGKLLGHSLIMAIATAIGFGSAAVVIGLLAHNVNTGDLTYAFVRFIITATLLGSVFISIAYFISAIVTEKSKAAGLALIFWFFFVLVFDLGLLALLVITAGRFQPDIFPYLLLLNPTDVFRLINLMGFNSAGTGLFVMASDLHFGYPLLIGVLMGWIILPFTATYFIFKHRRI